MITPGLASSGVFTAVVIISVYWPGVLVSLRGGIGVIAKLASSGVLIGTLIPGALLVILGIVYLPQGNASAAPMNASHRSPSGRASPASSSSSRTSAPIGHGDERRPRQQLEDPKSQFPRVMLLATVLVLLILILPPLGDQLGRSRTGA